MSIGTDSAIDFFGTQDEVTTSPATVADAAFSIASDTSTWTNDDDAREAAAVLKVTAAGLGGAPTGAVNLFLQPLNVDGSTGDQVFPTANFLKTFVGAFNMSGVDEDNNIEIIIPLPNGKTSAEYVPVIQNLSGVALGTTWQLYIRPKAVGPHA